MPKRVPPTVPHVASQTWATWLASLVAFVALIVSLISLYEAHEARVSSVRDEVLLRANRPMGDQPVSIKKTAGAVRFGSVTVPWDLMVSNTGNSTISITGYEASQIAGSKGQLMYSGLDRGLFSSESNQPLALPIVLEAGKSIRLLAVVGLNPGQKAYNVLAKTVSGTEETRSLKSVEKLLASKMLDIYDNPVTPLNTSGVVSGWRVEKQGKEQVFIFKIRTARGSEVKELASWYDFKRY